MQSTPTLPILLLFLSLSLFIPPTISIPPAPSAAALPPHCILPFPSLDTKYPAQAIISLLNLTTNPEKGFYIQTFEDALQIPIPFTSPGEPLPISSASANTTLRSASTAIYYLLKGDEGDSLWHRIDAAEVWHFYAGAPLSMRLSYDDGRMLERRVLGPDVPCGMRPQVLVGRWQWQSARSLGGWTLVGTTVAPGFSPSEYEIAAAGWEPRGGT